MTGPSLFSTGARRAVLVVGIVSFLGTVAVLLYGGDLVEPDAGPRDSYGRGVLGHRAFYETLDELGFSVTRLRHGRYKKVRHPVLFLEPQMVAKIEGRERFKLGEVLEQRANEGLASVVALPKWRCAGDPHESPLVEAERERDAVNVLSAAYPDEVNPDVNRGETLSARPTRVRAEGSLGRFTFRVAWPQYVKAPAGAEVLLASRAGALVLRHPETGTIVVSDPDLLHNWNLQRGGNTGVFAALLTNELRADVVYVDEVFHGHGRELSLGEALGSWPAVLLTIHGLVLALLFLWSGMTRFGPAQSATAQVERGPAEMIDTSAAVLAAGQPPGLLAARYVQIVLNDLSERLGARDTEDIAARVALIDRAAERAGEQQRASRVLGDAAALRKRPRAAAAALRVARRAWALHEALLGADQTSTTKE